MHNMPHTAEATAGELAERGDAMTTDELFRRLTTELPEGAQIEIYLGRGDCGMVMYGPDSKFLGEFADGVLPNVEESLLESLEICKKGVDPC